MNVLWRNLFFTFIIFISVICGGCNGEDLTIHNPDANTFFVPDDDEPLSVLLSFPDTWEPGSQVMMVLLLNDDGIVVRRQGYIPMTVPIVTIEPGSIAGQKRIFNIPAETVAGWHTIRAVAIRTLDDGSTERIIGDSERFWISHIGTDEGNAGLDVMLSDVITPPPYRPGGFIHIFSLEWGGILGTGFDCSDSTSDHHTMLFKGGSHGASHQHWLLERESGDMYVIPDGAPPGTDYFIWVNNGPLCNGTSDDFGIVAP